MFFRVFLPKHGLFFVDTSLHHSKLYQNCLVVWNMFYFPFHIWDKFSHWLIFFRGVGISPTRKHLLTTSYHMGMDQYLLNPINTIFSGMNIHLPAILGFTRGIGFWPIPISYPCFSWKKAPCSSPEARPSGKPRSQAPQAPRPRARGPGASRGGTWTCNWYLG